MPSFQPFADKMQRAGLDSAVIRTFRHAYAELVRGETGYIHAAEAQPVDAVPDAEAFAASHTAVGMEDLNRTVICKLNGGLGTGMGLNGPKALLPVKDGLNFLDILARQVIDLRRASGARLPLLLMNSFSTRAASLAALDNYPALAEQPLPLDFVQNMVPKVFKHDLSPALWPEDPEKEWCPPGHGDIYPSLISSGLLQQMLDLGCEYLFVSNSDNLGATLDASILGYFAASGAPFMMEVADRTPADRKGGHLARSSQGRLILRELAQCPPDELDDFQNIELYRYFNTNNLWIHLPSLARALAESDGALYLPLIRNEKPIDPTQPDSPRVYQLESAMGSAIGIFAGAQAVRVPRSRFAPVKKNSDLLALWSDAYLLTDDNRVLLDDRRDGVPPTVILDDRYYGLLDDMLARFPHGAPSLIDCRTLEVIGDVYFGANITARGDVHIDAPESETLTIPDSALLEDAA